MQKTAIKTVFLRYGQSYITANIFSIWIIIRLNIYKYFAMLVYAVVTRSYQVRNSVVNASDIVRIISEEHSNNVRTTSEQHSNNIRTTFEQYSNNIRTWYDAITT